MPTAVGLDFLQQLDFEPLKGKRIAVVCNQATVTSDYVHILDLLRPLHREGCVTIKTVMGPQHGLFGHTQDNMIEWEGHEDARTGIKIASLYGKDREPTDAMLHEVDLLVVDLPDIGARYYTFLWTTALCMKACCERGIPVIVLDRPNPIGGFQVEGPVLDPNYASFVGLHPLPTRHGMTLGEIATYFKSRFYAPCDLTVIEAEEWSRSDYIDDTDAPWTIPSPNMPTVDTATVYPGACLLEGTNLSEGRGTTRPFEIFGAPFLDGWKLSGALNAIELPGVRFQPFQFQPTFQKHAEEICEGCFVHVTDRRAFEPVLAYVAVLQEARREAPDKFAWNPPPYEYEYEKLPIDILAGNGWLREAIETYCPLREIRLRMLRECHDFEPIRKSSLLYPLGV
jgi:uncharacterized protein YbbC (DUF1343 family)